MQLIFYVKILYDHQFYKVVSEKAFQEVFHTFSVFST